MNRTLMKLAVLISITFSLNIVHGQFAIVSDKDGYVNVRSKPEVTKNISDTLRNGHLVYCLETQNNWVNIDYTKRKESSNGYVYRDRLKLISDFENIPVISDQPNNRTLGKDSIRVSVSIRKFDKNKYRLTYDKDSKEFIQAINGKDYWGTDGEMPTTE
jgi:uncharacterized protein YgiM (DUF1202 family)